MIDMTFKMIYYKYNDVLNIKIEGEENKKSGLVLGIISLIAWLLPLAGYPVSIVGLVRAAGGLKTNNKYSKAGLTLNIIGLVLTVINSVAGVIMNLKNM